MEDHIDYAEVIATDVMAVLAQKRFFDALDSQMCPTEQGKVRARCRGSYEISVLVLTTLDFDSQEIVEIISVLNGKGAHCDCEILYNIAESSRLKSEYWKCRARQLTPPSHGS
jgi:hypothetical protein